MRYIAFIPYLEATNLSVWNEQKQQRTGVTEAPLVAPIWLHGEFDPVAAALGRSVAAALGCSVAAGAGRLGRLGSGHGVHADRFQVNLVLQRLHLGGHRCLERRLDHNFLPFAFRFLVQWSALSSALYIGVHFPRCSHHPDRDLVS